MTHKADRLVAQGQRVRKLKADLDHVAKVGTTMGLGDNPLGQARAQINDYERQIETLLGRELISNEA